MNLVIVESPAKCSKIQGFLGFGYKVVASMGHIRALIHDLEAVGLNNNFEPKYEFMKEKASTIAKLKSDAKSAQTVILCSDDDREGEAIAYSLAVLLKLNVATNPRATFREITKNAVLNAIQHPRVIDMNRVHSQQARAMLDLMVGFTISPLLWKHIHNGQVKLSAGRCQTPALRLVCEKESSIDSFKSDSSWAVNGIWSANGSKSTWSATLIDPLGDDESALNYLENHKDEVGGIIQKAITKPWTESPPQALMTSTLQQQASNLYKYAPKRCMQIAQKLYEAGHITYMRTDQVIMSEEAVEQGKKVIESKWGKQYIGTPGVTIKKKSKAKEETPQAQEAHEAIRPTHFERGILPQDESWEDQDRKLYRLIWLRAIQSIMAQAKGEQRVVDFIADGDDPDFVWQSKWKRVTFPGWKIADEKETNIASAEDTQDDKPEDTNNNEWTVAEELKQDHRVKWHMLKVNPQETKPQSRFTEASLVRDLEKKGIGRPSTFASLISTILEKGYVEIKDIPTTLITSKTYSINKLGQWPPKEEPFQIKRGGEKTRLVPTPLGNSILDFTLEKFPDLFSYTFTSTMETRLDKVAEGSEPWKKVLEDTWNSYKERYETLKNTTTNGSNGLNGSNPKRREFGNNLVAVMSSKGPLLLKEGATKEETIFFGWPAKKSFQTLTEQEANTFVESVLHQKQGDLIGEYNGHPILIKKGQYGAYAECNGIRISLGEDRSLNTIVAKLQEKTENPSRSVGPFQIRKGQYGPYLMKSGKGKPVCVSIPKDIDIDQITAQQAGEIFEAGLKAKVQSAKKKFKKRE